MLEEVYRKNQLLSDDELTKMILDYLNETIYNYAILIDGQWGSGKTYYIEEKLLDSIEKNEGNKGKEESKNCKARKPIYISLYGIKSVSEISGQLYMNIIKDNTQMSTKLLGKVTSACKAVNDVAKLFGKGVDINSENINDIFEKFTDINKYILIFDDLERCECDINEVLGYINNFVEHEGVKVIIVANEAEIGKQNIAENLELKYLLAINSSLVFDETNKVRNEDKNNITLEELKNRTNFLFGKNIIYNEIKEKLIGVTIKYDPDISDVLENMITKKFDRYEIKTNLLKKIPEYIEYMNKKNHKNLRTFQFFLAKVSQLFKQVEVSNYQAKDFVINSLLDNCFKLSIQYKNGEYIDTWDNLEEYGYKFIDKKNKYDCVFVFRFMDNFIINNILDVFKAKDVLDECHTEFVQSQKNPDSSLNKLESCWYLISESEILDLILQVIESLRRNEYSVKTYSRIIRIFVELSLIGFEEKYLNKVMELMIHNIDSNNIYEYIDSTIILSEKNEKFNVKFKELFSIIKGRMELKKNKTEKIAIESCFDMEKWVEKLQCYVDENKNIICFQEGFLLSFDNKLLTDKLLTSTPSELMRLRQIMYAIYESNGYTEILTKDMNKLNELNEFLSVMDISKYDKIQAMHLNYLKNELSEIYNKYVDIKN